MTRVIPEVPGALSADEVLRSAEHIAGLQLPTGEIPWWPGGHCDPWNHVETAMALDVAGLHAHARHAYRWLADIQHDSGAWFNYYQSDGDVEDRKLDTNVCAYVATGVWHHWLSTGSTDDAAGSWPMVKQALDWVLAQRRPDGMVLWAVHSDGTREWDYALLTGSSSITHALRCGVRLGELLDDPQPVWAAVATQIAERIRGDERAFEDKSRWAMDWYYPVLAGVLDEGPRKERLAHRWGEFVMDGLGVRCVSDEPWITASETAECALAYSAIGDNDTATDLLAATRSHRRDDGAYWTGIVYPDAANDLTAPVQFPFEEHSAYTAAAVILAADAISGATPAAGIFSTRP